MAETQITVRGIEDMKAAVEALTGDLRRKVVIGALMDAARPIVKAARALAPYKSGLVRSRIAAARSKIYRGSNGTIGVFIRVRPEKATRIKGTKLRYRIKQNDPYYAKFLEGGTKKMAARPFLGPAAEAHFAASAQIVIDRISERIELANHRV